MGDLAAGGHLVREDWAEVGGGTKIIGAARRRFTPWNAELGEVVTRQGHWLGENGATDVGADVLRSLPGRRG